MTFRFGSSKILAAAAALTCFGAISSAEALPAQPASTFDTASAATLVQYREGYRGRDWERRRWERHREYRRWQRERDFDRYDRHRRMRHWERRYSY